VAVTNAQPFDSRREILKMLNNLKVKLLDIIDRDFKGSPKLRSYVLERIKNAKSIIQDLDLRLRDISSHGIEGYRIVFVSSEYLEKGGEKTIVVRKLTGGIAVIRVGAPVEKSIHIVEISKWRLKCTCPDAVFLSAKADKVLTNILKHNIEPLMYKYVLCKHTLAGLSILLTLGALKIEDPILTETIWLSLLSAYLRIADSKDIESNKSVLMKGLKILEKRTYVKI